MKKVEQFRSWSNPQLAVEIFRNFVKALNLVKQSGVHLHPVHKAGFKPWCHHRGVFRGSSTRLHA